MPKSSSSKKVKAIVCYQFAEENVPLDLSFKPKRPKKENNGVTTSAVPDSLVIKSEPVDDQHDAKPSCSKEKVMHKADIKSEMSGSDDEDDHEFRCLFCDKPFDMLHHLLYHLRLHMRRYGGQDVCPRCSRVFRARKQAFINHVMLDHVLFIFDENPEDNYPGWDKDDCAPKVIECAFCEKVFTSNRTRISHEYTKHQELLTNRYDPRRSRSRSYVRRAKPTASKP